jgi:hypothetical protein
MIMITVTITAAAAAADAIMMPGGGFRVTGRT